MKISRPAAAALTIAALLFPLAGCDRNNDVAPVDQVSNSSPIEPAPIPSKTAEELSERRAAAALAKEREKADKNGHTIACINDDGTLLGVIHSDSPVPNPDPLTEEDRKKACIELAAAGGAKGVAERQRNLLKNW